MSQFNIINPKLVDSGLFASRLVTIEGPMVDRYNNCLTQLGFTPTSLTSFRIDGYGWSPEIAQEKNNPAYLSHGDANPFAIILSPNQAGLPVFYPFHNFDRKMMEYVYADYAEQIEEITATTGLIIDIDRYVHSVETPLDLLSYNRISIRAIVIGDLLEGKKEQDLLIEQMMEGDNFLSRRMQQKLLGNVKHYEDLRGKNIMIEPQSFDVESFYTRLFGGVFILRDRIHQQDLIIVNDAAWVENIPKSTAYSVKYIQDPKLLSSLRKRGYVEEISDNAMLMERMKKWAFVSAIAHKNRENTMDAIMNNAGLFQKYFQQHRDEMALFKAIESGKLSKEPLAGLIPHSQLGESQSQLIWQLLTTIHYYDIFMLYKWNKEKFFTEFESFPHDVQDWIVEFVVEQNHLYYKDQSDD